MKRLIASLRTMRCVVSSVDARAVTDACCDTCGLRPVVEVSLYSQPGMVDRDVSACVEEGDVLVFEGDPRAAPVLFAVSRPMWEGTLVSSRGWREFVVAAGACGCQRRRVEVATVGGARAAARWARVRSVLKRLPRAGASCAMMSVNTV